MIKIGKDLARFTVKYRGARFVWTTGVTNLVTHLVLG